MQRNMGVVGFRVGCFVTKLKSVLLLDVWLAWQRGVSM